MPRATLHQYSKKDILRETPASLLTKLVDGARRLFWPKSELFLFGSSILWGQGHEQADKIGQKTAKWIENRFKERVRVHQMAHSGAFLSGDPEGGAPRLHGEIPTPWPSVMEQVRISPKPKSSKVRILIEGGINEVGGNKIFSPATSPEYLASATKEACYVKLKAVLGKLSARFPGAEIYVIGYYQILADRARHGEVEEMLKQDPFPEQETDGWDFDFADRAIGNSRRFRELSDHWIKLAAKETAESHGGSCEFVASGFAEQEGMFGDPTLVFSPWTRDPMRRSRALHCTVAIARAQTGVHCYLAATAHPNGDGLGRYVSQITAAIEERER